MNNPPAEYCCFNCFTHPTLLEIVKHGADTEGQCDFCGSESVLLLHVSALYDSLNNAVRMYHPAVDGDTVAPWDDAWAEGDPLYIALDEDWHVFSELLSGHDAAAELLRAILESGWDDDSGESFPDPHALVVRRSSWVHQTPAECWRDFSYAIRHDGSLEHYIPESVEEDIHILRRELSQSTLFRARLGFDTDQMGRKVPYALEKIGAPPSSKPGRANRQGEVVFYAAEQRETAVAEIRPARGLLVSVGTFEIKQPTVILDLLHNPAKVDPFIDESFEYLID